MKDVKKLFEQYKGTLKEEKDSSYHKIELSCNNTLPINNPNKKEKKVMCHINIFKTWNGEYNINYYEETYEILGGGCTTVPREEVIERAKTFLDRYCFKKNAGTVEQMRLF